MPEETATAAEEAAVDAATEQAKSERTFSQHEVDGIVKGRIDKQNAKHADEMAAKDAELASIREQLEAANKAKEAAEREAMLAKVSKETGLDASALAGTTEEELLHSAEVINGAIAAQRKSFPSTYESAGSAKPKPATREEIMSIQNDKERLAAIKANVELFQ